MSRSDRSAQGRTQLTRRRFLLGASAVAAGAAVGVGVDRAVSAGGKPIRAVALEAPPRGLPTRQHAWEATLKRNPQGNSIAPRFDRLLLFDVNGAPSPAYARTLEASLRTLERTYPWGPQGLLFTAGWSHHYFEHVLGIRSPIPRARALSDFELPSIDTYDVCLHLACDDERRLGEVEAALIHGAALSGASGPLDLSQVLSWRETRTGFTGPGLPAAHQKVGGIPAGDPVPKGAPLFMGFKSNLKRNQASEDDVTIASGPLAGGTTMHVSYMRLRLDSWYTNLSHRDRVARMFAPQVSPREAADFTTDAKSDPNLYSQAVNRYGVVGHAQTSARARRHGKPLILRRDFDTVDGGLAGLHFVAVQRTIEDFVTTRTAMNAASAQLQNPSITGTVNNGINEFIFVLKRANYILPPRPQRSFPMLPGRSGALQAQAHA